jgi:hypothetical protein
VKCVQPKVWRGILLLVLASLASCADTVPTTRIKVTVADNYSGPIYLASCVEGAQDPVMIDPEGHGQTSACPARGDVEIDAIKAGRTIAIQSGQIDVTKTGDGIAVGFTTYIP